MCPYAREVSLLNGLSDQNIQKLNSLCDIQVLKLSNFHEQILTFKNGLLLYLRQKGKQLTELDLSDISSVDVIEIGRTCPNLQRFSYSQTRDIADFQVSAVKPAEKRSLFCNITHLKVVIPVLEENFPAMALECIFCNARKLVKIQLFNVKALTSDLIIFSLSHNNMSSLTEVILEDCNGITGEGIMGLLEAENDLTVVSLQNCQQITLRDHEKFLKFGRRNNFDINLEWI